MRFDYEIMHNDEEPEVRLRVGSVVATIRAESHPEAHALATLLARIVLAGESITANKERLRKLALQMDGLKGALDTSLRQLDRVDEVYDEVLEWTQYK